MAIDNTDQVNWTRFTHALQCARLQENRHKLALQLEALQCFCRVFAWAGAEQIIVLALETLTQAATHPSQSKQV